MPIPSLSLKRHSIFPLPLSFLKILYIYFWRDGKGGEKTGRETSVCERYINLFPLTCPQLGTWPTTQACQTCNLSFHGLVFNPLSHISQGVHSLSYVPTIYNGKSISMPWKEEGQPYLLHLVLQQEILEPKDKV